MKTLPAFASAVLCLLLSSCYSPVKDKEIYPANPKATQGPGVTATFLGNTTIFITDGQTHLLVDGFLSRPGAGRIVLGELGIAKVEPVNYIIKEELHKAGISKIDAILVGHSHYDHALDTHAIAKLMPGTAVMGSKSYGRIHRAMGAPTDHLIEIPASGGDRRFGKFKVTFKPSDHVAKDTWMQRRVEGQVPEGAPAPTRSTDYKCGDVFAIHIAHDVHGSMAVTTSAGFQKDQFRGVPKAAVMFLGVGLLGNEPEDYQRSYWKESVAAVNAKTVIPVHWDSFTRKLSRGLKSRSKPLDDVKGAVELVKVQAKGEGRNVRAMDLRDSIRLYRGRLQ